jgi:hypothetical protein
MKLFLITWGLFCLLVIMGLFIAYATDQLPGVPAPKQVGLQVEDSRNGAEEGCSPCEANLARLQKLLEQQEASQGHSGVSTP